MALTINKQPAGGELVLANSPVLIQVSSTNIAQTDFAFEVEVYIWTGASSAQPSTANFTLRKKPNSALGNRAIFDLSQLINDEFELPQLEDWGNRVKNSEGTAVWAKAICKGVWDGGSESTTGNGFYAVPGYSYSYNQEPNHNYNHSDSVGLIDSPNNMEIFGSSMYIPVYRPHHTGLRVTDGINNHTQDITSKVITESEQRLVHIDILDIINDEGITGDTITVTLNGANNVVYKFIKGCTRRFEAYPVAFVNKFGCLQYLFFQGKTTKSISVESKQFNRPMFYDGFNIDVSKNTGSAYGHKGKVTYQLNTQILGEEINSSIEQLLVSPKIMLYVDSTWRSVNVLNKKIDLKTSLNDRMVSYSLQFEESADYLNIHNS